MYYEESKGFSWNKKMGIVAASMMLAGAGMFGAAAVMNSGSAGDTGVLAESTAGAALGSEDGIGTSPGNFGNEVGASVPGGSSADPESSDSEPDPTSPPSEDPDPGNPDPGGPGGFEMPDSPMDPPAVDPNPTPEPDPVPDFGDLVAEEIAELLDS